MRQRRWFACLALAACLAMAAAAPAYANSAIQGVADIITAPLELPLQALAGTLSGPPIIGTVFGLLSGACSAVGKLVRGAAGVALGAVQLGASAAPLAPLALPFVL